jgi:predicted protein tyrosine phosphatase
MKKLLFVRNQNELRSPTAEAIFSNDPDLVVRSAGLNNDAEAPLGAEDIEWAEIIFVMEQARKRKLQKRFKASLKSQKLVCLSIPDDYEYMQSELIALSKKKLPQFLQGI